MQELIKALAKTPKTVAGARRTFNRISLHRTTDGWVTDNFAAVRTDTMPAVLAELLPAAGMHDIWAGSTTHHPHAPTPDVSGMVKRFAANDMAPAKVVGYAVDGTDVLVQLRTDGGLETILSAKVLARVGINPLTDMLLLTAEPNSPAIRFANGKPDAIVMPIRATNLAFTPVTPERLAASTASPQPARKPAGPARSLKLALKHAEAARLALPADSTAREEACHASNLLKRALELVA